MLDAFWTWLRDPANQQTLGWIGGGLVVVIGGVWAIVKFFAKREGDTATPPNVNAKQGGVAIGGSNVNSPIATNSGRESSGKTRKPKA